MAHKVLECTQETSTSTGAGALALAGATTRMQTIAAGLSDGDTSLFRIENQSAAEWAEVVGQYGVAGNTITPIATLRSSTGSAISFSAGTKVISAIAPATPIVRTVRTITSGTSTAMTALDYELVINKTVSGAHSVTPPPNMVDGQEFVVSDGKGDLDVGANNITVLGTVNGQTNFALQAKYQSVRFRWRAASNMLNTVS